MTQPPAASILLVSNSLFGLWSYDNGSTTPLTDAIALESTTFA